MSSLGAVLSRSARRAFRHPTAPSLLPLFSCTFWGKQIESNNNNNNDSTRLFHGSGVDKTVQSTPNSDALSPTVSRGVRSFSGLRSRAPPLAVNDIVTVLSFAPSFPPALPRRPATHLDFHPNVGGHLPHGNDLSHSPARMPKPCGSSIAPNTRTHTTRALRLFSSGIPACSLGFAVPSLCDSLPSAGPWDPKRLAKHCVLCRHPRTLRAKEHASIPVCPPPAPCPPAQHLPTLGALTELSFAEKTSFSFFFFFFVFVGVTGPTW
jgi:hypothetical protein